MKQQDRNYRLLDYLNVKARTSYLGRIRNPNPKMPDADNIGVACPGEKARSGRSRLTTQRHDIRCVCEQDRNYESVLHQLAKTDIPTPSPAVRRRSDEHAWKIEPT